MIIIEDTLISDDIFTENFICDLTQCKGACCVEGDLGAPLMKEEISQLEDYYSIYKQFMRPEGIAVVETQEKYHKSESGELTTPLISNKDCAYVFFDEEGIAKCAIEKAYDKGLIKFKKPISCHLYPIRIVEYSNYESVNYHKWQICNCAVYKGNFENVKVYEFLKEALIRKYGKSWYTQLDEYVKSLRKKITE